MPPTVVLVLHITAGAVGLLVGYTALSVKKGAPLHRKMGMVFVYSMCVMAVLGMLLAAVSGVWVEVNVPAGWTTAYLVTTSLVTVRRPEAWSRRLDIGLMVAGLAVGLMMLTFGIEAVASGGRREGIPAFPFFLFGVSGTLAGIGDLRVLVAGARQGAARLARHLWRMCFALFVAAMSFFIGQSDEFPQWMRIYPLLALPALWALVAMVYWLWKVRRKSGLRDPLIDVVGPLAGAKLDHAGVR